jgi:hypothetical protein
MSNTAKPKLLMVVGEISDIYSKIETKHMNTLCGSYAGFLTVKGLYSCCRFLYIIMSVSEVMLYHDLKEGLDKEPAKIVLKYLGLDVQPEKAQLVGQKIWNFYLQNVSLSYGTNLVKLAEV